MTKHTKKGSGGKRKGAGRPKALRIYTATVQVKCHPEHANEIKQAAITERIKLENQ
jgi:hypothetical protein